MDEFKGGLMGDWKTAMKDYLNSEKWDSLRGNLNEKIKTGNICPSPDYIFRAFEETKLDDVKCIIIGDDPYHSPGTANGLSFGVSTGLIRPVTLTNVIKELERDLGIFIPKNKSSLLGWAKQGVLMLNTSLTTEKGHSGSHRDIGWDDFTDSVVDAILKNKKRVAFVLWGEKAKAVMANTSMTHRMNHKILEAAHPSPKSVNNGFFGCKHFSQVNTFLKKYGMEEIDWSKIDLCDLLSDDSITLPEWTDKDDFYERRYNNK